MRRFDWVLGWAAALGIGIVGGGVARAQCGPAGTPINLGAGLVCIPKVNPVFTSVRTLGGSLPGDAPAGSVAIGGKYYGDGSELTGLPGGGDMTAAAYAAGGAGAPGNPCAVAGATYRNTTPTPHRWYFCPSAGGNWVGPVVVSLADVLGLYTGTPTGSKFLRDDGEWQALTGTTQVNGVACALGGTCSLTKSNIGLGNVDNTADAAKPVSTATQTALDGKVPTTRTVNGHSLSANVTVTKGDVGLGSVDNTSDIGKPVSTAQAAAINALQVFAGAGVYSAMNACSLATCPAGSRWWLTDAVTSGLCGQGSGTANTGFSICGRDASGSWLPIMAATAATGGGTGTDPTDPNIYGGFTGGGATVIVSDADCAAGDDTSTVQTKLSSVGFGGTLDFQNTTNPCDIGAAGLSKGNVNNYRVTTSVTPPANGTLRGVSAGTYSTPYSTILYLENGDNVLVDKIKVNGNSTLGQGIFLNHMNTSSIQNAEFYGNRTNTGPPYAAVKCDGCVNSHIRGNNIHDLTDTGGAEGLRAIWCGTGGDYSTGCQIHNNTITNTRHTAIAIDGSAPVVTNNLVTNVLNRGTAFKYLPRGAVADAIFDNNTGDNTYNAVFQLEPTAGMVPSKVYLRNNQFKNSSQAPGSTFGAFYFSGSAGGGSQNVVITGNTLTSCKAVANINNGHNITFQNNTLVTPVGADGSTVVLENNNSNIRVINSGTVVMQAGCTGTCSGIYQDGVQLAGLPIEPRILAVALVRVGGE